MCSRTSRHFTKFYVGYFDQCGNPAGVKGTFDFNAMISAGFLNATGDPASGTQHRFDDCSKTVSR